MVIRYLIVFGAVLVSLISFIVFQNSKSTNRSISNLPTQRPTTSIIPKQNQLNSSKSTTTIATNLEVPWAIAFLPDGRLLVTERPGRVRTVDQKSGLNPTPIATIPEVKKIGEGGLLGLALHPNFKDNKFLFLYYTYSQSNDQTLNRVARYTFDGTSLKDPKVIVDKIPGAPNHNGGRVKFGPDGFLYITTGDAQNPSQAQDTNSLGGKILRVTDAGQKAPDNPFNNLVYSYGHRNPQGLAWDSQNRLWATEHGRSGALSGLDELNLIEKGKNYGWPSIQGDETAPGLEAPKLHSGSNTWAPAGAAFINNSVFFGGLRGQTLYQANFNGQISLSEHLKNQFGRIREAIIGPDNMLYLTTSNQDGRGTPSLDDDKIIKIDPEMFIP